MAAHPSLFATNISEPLCCIVSRSGVERTPVIMAVSRNDTEASVWKFNERRVSTLASGSLSEDR